MQVGFFDIHLTTRETGIGRYGYELTSRLKQQIDIKILKMGKLSFSKKFLKIFFAPLILHLSKLDILHVLTPSEVAFEFRTKLPCKLVVTVHDLLPLTFHENWPARHNFLFKKGLKKSINLADKIIFVSNTVRNEFLKIYDNFDIHKTCVIYNGVDLNKFQLINNAQICIEKKYGITQDFFLFVGKLEKRKNIAFLLDVIKEINILYNNYILLLIGPNDPFYPLRFNGLPVKQLDFIADDDLPLFYSAASGFIFPSLYEGFGIPIAEAMACGCPVICSDIPVLKEIYAGAAIFCSPYDKVAWYNAMRQVITDKALRNKLRIEGFNKSKTLEWDNAIKEILKVYKTIKCHSA